MNSKILYLVVHEPLIFQKSITLGILMNSESTTLPETAG